MKDAFAAEMVALADQEDIRAILAEVCTITGMGFAAVACVTDDRWIACQVLDKIEFGLDAGDELVIKTTICDEIRQSGRAVIIDHVAADPDWRLHHTPALYGFESYASLPLFVRGAFFGTLCAIDPGERHLSAAETVAALGACARRVETILSQADAPPAG